MILKSHYHLQIRGLEEVPAKQITTTNDKILRGIRSCESKLREIKEYKLEHKIDDNIKKNVEYSLAMKLRELTKDIKILEKNYLDKMKKMHYEEHPDLEMNDKPKEENLNQIDLQDFQSEDYLALTRNEEITEIVKQTAALAELFKELSEMVIEQGTIVDRIDCNIETALVDTKEGRKFLKKAKDASNNSRAKSTICCLLSFIMVFIVIFILKHTVK